MAESVNSDDEIFSRQSPPPVHDSLLLRSPHELFSEADVLFKQSSALRVEAAEWQTAAEKQYYRANRLETIGKFLQKVATEDRNAITEVFDNMIDCELDAFRLYEESPERQHHVQSVRLSVEEGTITMKEVEAFKAQVLSYSTEGRDLRQLKRKASQQLQSNAKTSRCDSALDTLRSLGIQNLFSPGTSTNIDQQSKALEENQSTFSGSQTDTSKESSEVDDMSNASGVDETDLEARSTSTHSESLSDDDTAAKSMAATEQNCLTQDILPHCGNQDVQQTTTASRTFSVEATPFETDSPSLVNPDAANNNDVIVKEESASVQSESNNISTALTGRLTDAQTSLLMKLYPYMDRSPDVARNLLRAELQVISSTTTNGIGLHSIMEHNKIIIYFGRNINSKPRRVLELLRRYGHVVGVLTRKRKDGTPRIFMVTFDDETPCRNFLHDVASGKYHQSSMVAWKPVP